MSEIWIVGQHRGDDRRGVIWEFQGAYTSEQRAVNACRNDNYFVARVELDQVVQDAPIPWEGARYPRPDDGGLQPYNPTGDE